MCDEVRMASLEDMHIKSRKLNQWKDFIIAGKNREYYQGYGEKSSLAKRLEKKKKISRSVPEGLLLLLEN